MCNWMTRLLAMGLRAGRCHSLVRGKRAPLCHFVIPSIANAQTAQLSFFPRSGDTLVSSSPQSSRQNLRKKEKEEAIPRTGEEQYHVVATLLHPGLHAPITSRRPASSSSASDDHRQGCMLDKSAASVIGPRAASPQRGVELPF